MAGPMEVRTLIAYSSPITLYRSIDAFPTQEDGSVYIEAGSAKRTVKQLVQQHLTAVDSTLYVNNFGPGDLYGHENPEIDIKNAAGHSRDAMNDATTASECWTVWQNILTIINANTKLLGYQALETSIAAAEEAVLDTSGDSTTLELLQAVLAEAKGTLAAYTPSGISQYRPAGQADSFTEDSSAAASALSSAATQLDEIVAAYEATLPEDVPYEEQIAEEVIAAMDAIIAYLDIPSVTIDDDLQVALDAYEADPNAETLGALAGVWDGWTYGGQDADCVFFTDYFVSLIDAFPKNAEGEIYIEAGEAKKSPKDIVQRYLTAVDNSLYVNDFGPNMLYEHSDPNLDIKNAAGHSRDAMNDATTASECWTVWQNILTIINANTKLLGYQALETSIAAAEEAVLDTSGDSTTFELLQAVLAEAKGTLAAYKPSGISQYRPAGQADSFTEDSTAAAAALSSTATQLDEIVAAYEATIPAGPEGLVFEEDGDIVYYENGVKVAKGLVEHEGSYYFINSTLKAVKDCEYAFSEKASNGLMPAGKYTFGADGKMIIKEGLVFETNGDICYYENGIKVAKGLVQDEYGNYYFINSTLKAVKNCEYAFSTEKANGLLSSGGKYTFDADGKMIVPENGLVFEEDGDIVYYENGVKVAKGLGEHEGSYYFINSTLKAVKDCEYAFSEKASNGLMPAGKYTFGADGKMILD